MPWFVVGFIAMIVRDSLITIPAYIKAPGRHGHHLWPVNGDGCHGSETDVRKLRIKGLQPFLQELIAFFFISRFSLLLIRVMTDGWR